MYYLKENSKSYYCGMICGLIVEVSEDVNKAKKFNTKEDALREIEEYKIFISDLTIDSK